VSAGVKRAAAATLVMTARLATMPATMLATLLATVPAHAHPEPPSTLINRYVTLWVSGPRLDVQFSLLHGPLTAAEARRQIDRDRSGGLSEAELVQYGRDLAAGAQDLITVEVDGRPLPLRWTPRIDLNGDPAVAAVPLVRELAGSAALAPGEHRLEVQLGPPFARLGDTEVALEAGDGWSLIASVPPAGVSALGRQDRFQLPHGHGQVEGGIQALPRVAFVVRSGTAGQRPGALVLPLVAVIAGAAAAAVWWFRRRRQRA
jgi:hypothetical protein